MNLKQNFTKTKIFFTVVSIFAMAIATILIALPWILKLINKDLSLETSNLEKQLKNIGFSNTEEIMWKINPYIEKWINQYPILEVDNFDFFAWDKVVSIVGIIIMIFSMTNLFLSIKLLNEPNITNIKTLNFISFTSSITTVVGFIGSIFYLQKLNRANENTTKERKNEIAYLLTIIISSLTFIGLLFFVIYMFINKITANHVTNSINAVGITDDFYGPTATIRFNYSIYQGTGGYDIYRDLLLIYESPFENGSSTIKELDPFDIYTFNYDELNVFYQYLMIVIFILIQSSIYSIIQSFYSLIYKTDINKKEVLTIGLVSSPILGAIPLLISSNNKDESDNVSNNGDSNNFKEIEKEKDEVSYQKNIEIKNINSSLKSNTSLFTGIVIMIISSVIAMIPLLAVSKSIFDKGGISIALFILSIISSIIVISLLAILFTKKSGNEFKNILIISFALSIVSILGIASLIIVKDYVAMSISFIPFAGTIVGGSLSLSSLNK